MGVSHFLYGAMGAILALGGAHVAHYGRVSWSDGDSGVIGNTRFRLMDVDAPERRGAKCDAEDQLADEAKTFMEDKTRWGFVWISETDGRDSSGRLLVRLSANGLDLIEQGLASGYLKPWPHDGFRAISARPIWCAVNAP